MMKENAIVNWGNAVSNRFSTFILLSIKVAYYSAQRQLLSLACLDILMVHDSLVPIHFIAQPRH